MSGDIDKALGEIEELEQSAKVIWREMCAVVRAAEHRHEQGGHSRFCRKMTHDEACSCGDEALAAALAALAAKVGANG
jgi:hypothetical protein